MSLAARFAHLWTELRTQRPILPPSEFKPSGPRLDGAELLEKDRGETPPTWSAQPISGRRLIIRYTASNGVNSERQVICRNIAMRGGEPYLSAHCLFRDAPRVFRIDRITAAIDPTTGEVFEPAESLFAMFAPDIVTSSRLHYGLHPRAFADFNAALNVLAFVARCDGRWHALEGEAIADFTASFWLRAEIDAPLDETEVARHAARLAPDPETFWAALDRCAANPIIARIIQRHVVAIVDADGHLHPQEQYWGQAIDEVLRSI